MACGCLDIVEPPPALIPMLPPPPWIPDFEKISLNVSSMNLKLQRIKNMKWTRGENSVNSLIVGEDIRESTSKSVTIGVEQSGIFETSFIGYAAIGLACLSLVTFLIVVLVKCNLLRRLMTLYGKRKRSPHSSPHPSSYTLAPTEIDCNEMTVFPSLNRYKDLRWNPNQTSAEFIRTLNRNYSRNNFPPPSLEKIITNCGVE